jgi:hypothetical protein
MNKLLFSIACIALLFSCKKNEEDNLFFIDNSFQFTLEDTMGVVADGKSVVKLSVKKLIETNSGLTVEFKTDKGSLTTDNVPFEGEYANTYLKLVENENAYYLLAKIKDSSGKLLTEKSIIYKPNAYRDTFEIMLADTASLTGNGNTEFRIIVKGNKSDYHDVTVSFESSKGDILKKQVGFDENMATTYLKVSRATGNYHITATVKKGDNTIAIKSIVCTVAPALPSYLFMESNKSLYDTETTLTITSVLLDHLETNNISEGLRLMFSAYQVSSTNERISVGNFTNALNIRTDLDGKVSDVTFMPNLRLDTTKVLYIEGRTQGITGNQIIQAIELEYGK